MKKPPMKPPRNKPAPDVPNHVALAKAQGLVAGQVTDPTSPANVPTRTDGGSGVTPVTPIANAPDGTGQPVETTTLQERHEQRMAWFYSEAARQASNRAMRARCEAFYDSEQYDEADAAEIEERGQKVVVYNEIKPTIDFLIGTERRSRVDFSVVAEDDDPAADDDAITKTKLIKYLEDVNNAGFERSEVADDQFKAGLGVLEVGLRGDKTGVPVFVGHVPWKEFLHDSRAKKDQSDARYNFRVKLVDLDIAIALLPEHEDALRGAVIQGDAVANFKGIRGMGSLVSGLDSFDSRIDSSGIGNTISSTIDLYNARERVLLIECWSREPQKRPLEQGGLGDPITFKIRVSIMVESETLLETWSPFKHDRFPFVLYWAYRNKRTGMPYPPTFSLLGPQEALNHRMSRALFEASFNQMELESSAIEAATMDLEELRTEYNDPNGMAVLANGALSGNKVRKVQNSGKMQEHLQLAQFDRTAIRELSSVNDENRGLASTSTSRVAMDAKAERGSVGTAELFDSQLYGRQQEGELVLSVCEQFVVQPMTIRVAGEQGTNKYQRTKINQPQADGSILNDISARQAHFVIGEAAWKQSYAEAAFDSLMEVMTQLASAAPQVVVALLDVVFDMHPNLPRKKAVLERIRAVNGQTDPDGKATPEQIAAQQQKAQVAQAQYQAQMAQLQADIKKGQAQGEKFDADAVLTKVTALYEAAQAALVLAQAPGVTPIADQILASAGFIDQSGSPNTIDASQVQPIQQPAQPGQPGQGQAGQGQPPRPVVPTQPVNTRGGAMAHMGGPQLMHGDGAAHGIETMRADGATPPPGPPAANPGAQQ